MDFKGKSLVGDKIGDLKKEWIVIAEDDLGDPIFIDTDDIKNPIFTAQHGNGIWKEIKISDTFENFLIILENLKLLSKGRENPESIEENPIANEENNSFLSTLKKQNPTTEIWFWEDFLENV